MNINRHSILSISTLSLLLAARAYGAEILSNGNLESFSSGIPTSWRYTQGDGPVTLESFANVSPFTNIYPSSTRSALFTDGTTDTSRPLLEQFFPTQTGDLLLSFDFRLSALAGDAWLCIPAASTGFSLNNIRLGGSIGTFALSDNSPGSGTISTLTAGSWYQVSVLFNLPGATYSGSITPFGGTPTTWNNRSLFNFSPVNDLAKIVFDDIGNAPNGPIAIDNVSVQTVPEPSTFALLGLAGSWILLRLRHSRRAMAS